MNERELRGRLRSIPLPRQGAGEERAWQVVRAAQVASPRAGARRWVPRGAGLLAACALALLAVVLASASPPRDALARWLRQAIGFTSVPPAHDTLAGLPGGGRLLVSAGATDWILTSGANRHLLGRYAGAQLSPHGLYVAAWRANQISALTPRGKPAWTRTAPATISLARWSADGYRIAYLAAGSLRVIAGDGSNDHDLVDKVAPVAPAWQPLAGGAHRVALVDRRGALELRDSDSGSLIWSRRLRMRTDALLWSPDGRFLVGIRADRLVLYDALGRAVGGLTAPLGTSLEHVTFAPAGGDRIAFVLHRNRPLADSVEVVLGTPAGLRAPALLLTLPEAISGLAWSPAGDRLVSASPASDQWTAIGARPPFRLLAIGQIGREFAAPGTGPRAFPAPIAWKG